MRKLLLLWPWQTSIDAHSEATFPVGLEADIREATFLHNGMGTGDDGIIAAVEEYKPDVCCVISVIGWGNFMRGLQWARQRCRLVYWCHDAACHTAHPLLELYRRRGVFDLVLTTDGADDWPHRKQDMSVLYPVHPRFYAADRPRTIRLGFRGGIAGKESRRGQVLCPLGDALNMSNRGPILGPYQDYADYMLGCRAIVSTAWSGTGLWKQAKGRVVEAGLAGCLLFDTLGAPTMKWFQPGEDYLEYEEPEDILAEVRRPEFDRLAEIIGKRLRAKVLKIDPHGTFWKAVMGE